MDRLVLRTLPVALLLIALPHAAARAQSADAMRLQMPGAQHKAIAAMAGTWSGQMKIWNSLTPQAPPFEMQEQTETKTILGGRFLLEEATGSMMGTPVRRMSILGFDNVKRVYTLTFYSSMDTATNNAEGSFDEAGRVLTMRGVFTEPQGQVPFRNVLRIENDDAHVFESYRIFPDGRELKVIEERMTRVK